jgi:phosphodiesterase/alkaline phosphatase D-like protein
MDRRRFLQLTAASLAAPSILGCPQAEDSTEAVVPPSVDPDRFDKGARVAFSPETVAVDEAVFPLGVQAGSSRAVVEGATAVLWTVVDGARPDLRLRVWRDSDRADEVVLVKDLPVGQDADADGVVKVVVDGLAPSTAYRYGFFTGDANPGGQRFAARSVLGQLRTAYAVDWVWPVTLGATTCTNQQHAPFRALERLAEQSLDVFVHLGDMVYADGSVTRDDYRAHWRRTLADPGFRALLPRAGGLYVWDDHEFDNNLDPERTAPEKIANARDEFFAHLPMQPNASGGLWQSWRWGRSVELFALDCRTERRPSTRETAQPVYLGDAQLAWLKQALKDSPCHFKVLLNSVPMTRMPSLWAASSDRWQGYEVQRAELLRFLQDNAIDNVWFLAGDFHVGFVSRVEATGFGRNVFEVAAGPGGNLGNPLAFLATQPEYAEEVFPSSQFFYGRGQLAATTLTFDPRNDVVRVRFFGTDGTVLFDEDIAKE